MKTKLLALAFSLIFLAGNTVRGAYGDSPKGPIHTLPAYVVLPYQIKLLNDQKLEPIDFDEIVRSNVEAIIEKTRRNQMETLITFALEGILSIPHIAAAE